MVSTVVAGVGGSERELPDVGVDQLARNETSIFLAQGVDVVKLTTPESRERLRTPQGSRPDYQLPLSPRRVRGGVPDNTIVLRTLTLKRVASTTHGEFITAP